MATEDVVLRPWALTDLESARDYMAYQDTSKDSALIETINRATGAINSRTRRMIHSMPYANPVTVALCSVSAGSTTLSTTASFASVRARMFVSGLPPGTFVASVTDDDNLELNQPADADVVAASLVFTGLGPSVLDGQDDGTCMLPEYPTSELITAKQRLSDGSYLTLDTTGWNTRGGIIDLPNNTFALGTRNIYVEHVSGITAEGDLDSLEGACLRLVQVMMLDRETPVGRGTGVTAAGFGIQLIDSAMPRDIAATVDRFKRSR